MTVPIYLAHRGGSAYASKDTVARFDSGERGE